MPALDDIIQVNVSLANSTISRASFGIPLVAGYFPTSVFPELVRTYAASTVLGAMVEDGFAVTSPTYLAVQALVSQNPRPRQIKVGRLASSWVQTYSIVPVAANTTVYSGRVNDQPWTFTSDGTALLAEVVTGIAAAIDALSGVTALGVGGTSVTVTADAAATVINFSREGSVGTYSVVDSTAAGNIVTDLTAILNADNDFYGLVIDRTSGAAIEAVAAWVEANRLIFSASTSDTTVLDPAVTTDVGSNLQDDGYTRTILWWNQEPDSFLGAAVLGKVLPSQPGTVDWYYQEPAGPPVSDLSATEEGALEGKNVNYLFEVANLRRTYPGKVSSGRFADITQAIDWVINETQTDVAAAVMSGQKMPYTNRSIERIKGVIDGVQQRGINRGVIADNPAPFVDAPKAEDVSEVDRANRVLPDVTMTFRLVGGIQKVVITGFASV
jgi:hypothetical protein